MSRVVFFHLNIDGDDDEELTAVSIEQDGTESDDEAQMYIWKCVQQCQCKFPDEDDIEESLLTEETEPDWPEPSHSLVHHRWCKERRRKEANKKLSERLHEAKREKATKLTSETQISPHTEPVMFPSNTAHDWPLKLGDMFVEECRKNSQKDRPSYNSVMYDISMLMYLSSAKSYRIIRQVLTLPSISSLYRIYSQSLKDHRSHLTDLDMIAQSLSEVKSEMGLLKAIFPGIHDFQFTLSIDAFSFQSFVDPCRNRAHVVAADDDSDDDSLLGDSDDPSEIVSVPQSQVQLRYGFVMMLIPHDYRIRPKILHLATSPSGAYSHEIGCVAHRIRQTCNAQGLRVWMKATDGDPGVSAEHEDLYQQHLAGKDSHFTKLVTEIHTWLRENSDAYIPIGDPLHVLKNVRAKLLTHPIQLYVDALPSDIDGIRSVLNIGAALNDDSQIGKMRDCYVTQLFTFENVAKLLESGQYMHGFLLLPFACWTTILFCTKITLNLRMFLVELAYQIIRHWTEQFPSLNAAGVACRTSASHPIITFNDNHHAKRILNTLAAFGVCLSWGSGNLRLDSMGTHPVENSIGVARAGSFSDPRYERILTAYVHAETRKDIARNLGLRLHVPWRINDGGCKIDPEVELHDTGGELAAKPEQWRVDDIIMLIQGACSKETGSGMENEVSEFAHELRELSPLLDVRHYKVGSTANSCIMARLISFGSRETVNEEMSSS